MPIRWFSSYEFYTICCGKKNLYGKLAITVHFICPYFCIQNQRCLLFNFVSFKQNILGISFENLLDSIKINQYNIF